MSLAKALQQRGGVRRPRPSVPCAVPLQPDDPEAHRLRIGQEVADAIVNTLRQLLCQLGSVLHVCGDSSVVGGVVQCRTLPALAESLLQLWLVISQDSTESWCTQDQAVWVYRLSVIGEGVHQGLLNFYGAGALLIESLRAFANQMGRLSLPETQLDTLLQGLDGLSAVLGGPHSEVLQSLPADWQCRSLAPIPGVENLSRSGGFAQMAEAVRARIPVKVRRSLGLTESGLTPAQTATLGAVAVIPGGSILAGVAVGTALLVDSVRRLGPADELWKEVNQQCLRRADQLLKQKGFQVQVCGEDIRGFIVQACREESPG